MNVYDIIIVAALAVILIVAVILTVRRKKRGGCSCGECSSCGAVCVNRKKEE